MDPTGNNPQNELESVLAHYLRKLDAGVRIDREELLVSHPELADELRAYFEQERLLWAAADPAETATMQATSTPGGSLEVRCPHCHAPMEVAVDTVLTDLTCDSCGSDFSLVDQSKATRMAPSLSKLGRFELIERIGVGGFGSVWKARDKELDRTVAIKIPRQGDMSAEEQEKFFREARAAAQLRHPGIVSVHEVGRDGDSVYIVSDFVRGVTLGDWLTGQQVTSREAAEFCAKIADALEHAHERGVVHRDLKPANVMIDGDGEPHLMDFGLARREVGEVTVTIDGQVVGTPAYMSPEQAQGESHAADRRSDVYSLGVILFQLLTGQLPFRGNVRMILHQVINEEAPSPRKLNATIPKDLETITVKCLEKDPGKRYQTAREASEELHRWLRGEPIHARPIRRVEKAWRWCKRHPSLAAASGTTLLLLLTVAIGATVSAVWVNALRVEADQQRELVEGVNDFFVRELIGLADPDDLQGADLALADAVDIAGGAIDAKFPNEPGLRARIHERFGEIYSKLLRPQKAIQHLEIAKRLSQETQGPAHAATLKVMRELAYSYFLARDYDKAEQECREALRLQQNNGNANDADVFLTAHTLCLVLWNSGNPSALQVSLDWHKRAGEALGSQHHETLALQSIVAQCYMRDGHPEQAVPYASAAYAGLRKRYGYEDRSTIHAAYFYAECLRRTGKQKEALSVCEELFDFQKTFWGLTNSDVMWTGVRLASLHAELGNEDIALAIANQFAVHHEEIRQSGADRCSSVCQVFASTLTSLGRDTEAVEFLRTACVVYARTRGSDTLASRRVRRELVERLIAMNRLEEARVEVESLVGTESGADSQEWQDLWQQLQAAARDAESRSD